MSSVVSAIYLFAFFSLCLFLPLCFWGLADLSETALEAKLEACSSRMVSLRSRGSMFSGCLMPMLVAILWSASVSFWLSSSKLYMFYNVGILSAFHGRKDSLPSVFCDSKNV